MLEYYQGIRFLFYNQWFISINTSNILGISELRCFILQNISSGEMDSVKDVTHFLLRTIKGGTI